MANNIQQTMQALAERFAAQMMAAMRGMPLGEILEASNVVSITVPKAGKGKVKAAPKASRSAATPKGAVTVEAIVSLVKKNPKGVAGDVIRNTLGIGKPAFYDHMNAALASKKVRKTGIKRATRYFAK